MYSGCCGKFMVAAIGVENTTINNIKKADELMSEVSAVLYTCGLLSCFCENLKKAVSIP